MDLPLDDMLKNLGDTTSADSGWWQLLDFIRIEGKYVNIDLSDWAINETSFNPDATNIGKPPLDPKATKVETGKDKIVSIVLPAAATSIEAGSSNDPTFMGFTNLRSISGENITTIGNYAFKDCSSLRAASFPAVETIGHSAFRLCSDLESINFPLATKIDMYAFQYCSKLQNASFPLVKTIEFFAFSSCSELAILDIPKVETIGTYAFSSTGRTPLSITMGSAAPSIGSRMFDSVSLAKAVIVKVPSGATGYTPLSGSSATVSGADETPNWANGFRGGGWKESKWGTDAKEVLSYINQNISLTIER
jgi:hypothetical protein